MQITTETLDVGIGTFETLQTTFVFTSTSSPVMYPSTSSPTSSLPQSSTSALTSTPTSNSSHPSAAGIAGVVGLVLIPLVVFVYRYRKSVFKREETEHKETEEEPGGAKLAPAELAGKATLEVEAKERVQELGPSERRFELEGNERPAELSTEQENRIESADRYEGASDVADYFLDLSF